MTTTDLQAVTYSISDISDSYYVLSISTTGGVLTITPAADYESQTDPSNALPYDGSTLDITATVTATDAAEEFRYEVSEAGVSEEGASLQNHLFWKS